MERLSQAVSEIYKEFDEAQFEYANHNNKQTDKYAEDVIYELAKLFKYNRGMRPTLELPASSPRGLSKKTEDY